MQLRRFDKHIDTNQKKYIERFNRATELAETYKRPNNPLISERYFDKRSISTRTEQLYDKRHKR